MNLALSILKHLIWGGNQNDQGKQSTYVKANTTLKSEIQ